MGPYNTLVLSWCSLNLHCKKLFVITILKTSFEHLILNFGGLEKLDIWAAPWQNQQCGIRAQGWLISLGIHCRHSESLGQSLCWTQILLFWFFSWCCYNSHCKKLFVTLLFENSFWTLLILNFGGLEKLDEWAAPWQNQQCGICTQLRLISLGIHPVWSVWASTQSDRSSPSAQWKLRSLAIQWAHTKGWSDRKDEQYCWFCHGAAQIHIVKSCLWLCYLENPFLTVNFEFREVRSLTNEPQRDKTNNVAFAPSEDSDQPGPSLIRVSTVHVVKT